MVNYQRLKRMKYRVLTTSELEPLNEEFLKYLLVANITPETWELLKRENPRACEKHIETFSDLVYDKILKDVRFIDVLSKDRVEVYQILQASMRLIAVENKTLGNFDFLEGDWSKLNLSTTNIIQGNKAFQENRESEVFALLQKKHATISDGTLFKNLALLVV